MIEFQSPDISIVRQCKLLKISRTSAYSKPKGEKPENLKLMRLMDEQYLKTPTHESRSMVTLLKKLGCEKNRKRIQRLMRLMGLEAICPKRKTSKPNPAHKIYPYLLRRLRIDHPNQVWATDISYLPMEKGFMYLVAVMDWYSRKVLSWRVSNTMDSDFCVSALKEAIHNYGCPEIFNTDQGSQFASESFTRVLKDKDIKISMDGRGRFQDNIFIERLWWTLKYHYFYLRTSENGSELRKGLDSWFQYYNQDRFHQSLENWTPDEIYHKKQELKRAA
jgi:putative transposase